MNFKQRASEIRSNIPAVLIVIIAIFSVAAIFVNSYLGGNGFTVSIAIGLFIAITSHTFIAEYATNYYLQEEVLVIQRGLIKIRIPYSKINFISKDHREYIYYTTNGKEATVNSNLLFPVEYDRFKKEFSKKVKNAKLNKTIKTNAL